MTDREKLLEEAGRRIASLVGEGPGPADIQAQESALITLPGRVRRRNRRLRLGQLAAAAVAVVGTAWLVASVLKDSPMDFSITRLFETRSRPVWFANEGGASLPITFADGSSVALLSGARGRVIKSTVREVQIVIESGTIETEIRSAGNTKWAFDAGPFTVKVGGTAFELMWDAGESLFEVAVSRGSVLVEGIPDHPSGLALHEGRRLTSRGNVVEVGPIERPALVTAGGLKNAAGRGSGTEQDSTSDGKAAAGGTPPSLRKTPAASATLAARRPAAEVAHTPPSAPAQLPPRGGEIVLATKDLPAGKFNALIESLDVVNLWALAESARYSRDAVRTRRALETLRDRFPQSAEARTAAFLLGRAALEYDKRPEDAARWFRAYRAETPGGPLDEEAAGRLIDALLKAGRAAEAREAAQEYLERYPNGIFAELARSAAKKLK